MCDKVVDTCPFISDFVPDWYKTQKMRDEVICNDPFMLKYCLNRYKTKKMCDKAVDDCLSSLKFVPDWFLTSKMLEKLCDVYLPIMI